MVTPTVDALHSVREGDRFIDITEYLKKIGKHYGEEEDLNLDLIAAEVG